MWEGSEHAALDAAVEGAYGFDGKKDLLELNLTVAALEKQGKKVTEPGSYGDARGLITEDCITP